MAAETIPAEPMAAAMRALLTPDAWGDRGTSRSAQASYAAREAFLDGLGAPDDAAIAARAYWGERDDPTPEPEGWAR